MPGKGPRHAHTWGMEKAPQPIAGSPRIASSSVGKHIHHSHALCTRRSLYSRVSKQLNLPRGVGCPWRKGLFSSFERHQSVMMGPSAPWSMPPTPSFRSTAGRVARQLRGPTTTRYTLTCTTNPGHVLSRDRQFSTKPTVQACRTKKHLGTRRHSDVETREGEVGVLRSF